jgi:hypothetical protein
MAKESDIIDINVDEIHMDDWVRMMKKEDQQKQVIQIKTENRYVKRWHLILNKMKDITHKLEKRGYKEWVK